jgi:ribosomal-protein-alanine N-acetyltransferase
MTLVKKIQEPDIQQVFSIENEVFGTEKYPYFFIKQAFELFPETFFGAFRNNRLIGYCLGATGNNKEKGWILSLAVSKKFVRQGVGSQLLYKTICALKEIGCKKVMLTVNPENQIGKKLFKNYGFQLKKIDAQYFGEKHPREIMVLSLNKFMEEKFKEEQR